MAGDLAARSRSVAARLGELGRRVRVTRGFAVAALAPAIAAVVTFVLVVPTLAPGVLDWDTAEFQTVGPVLGTAHPTGYPSYVILGFIASHLLPFGDAAYRMNLLQALLAAGAVAGTVAIVQYLTGQRWVALATGLLFLTMPTVAPKVIDTLPAPGSVPLVQAVATGPTLWSVSTHADPHLFHLALVSLLFLLLLVWDRRRHSPESEVRGRANRWLVAAALVYGVAVANHSLALLLAPAIGLFVLVAAPRILLEWRLVLTCAVVLAVTIVLLFLELPIRAAMHAPLVYGHPDTLSGFEYVVLAEQFRGSLIDPWTGLGDKYALVMTALAAWLGPLGYVALAGLGSSLVHRPKFVLLSVVAAAVACWFSASYSNAAIDRYYLVPLFVAFTFVGLGLADFVALVSWALSSVVGRSRAAETADASDPKAADPKAAAEASAEPAHAAAEPTEPSGGPDTALPTFGPRWRWVLVAIDAVAAIAVLAACLAVVPERESPQSGEHPGGVSLAGDTWRRQWVAAVLAPAPSGGLPENSVIVCWWSDSTTLWYGQRVEGLRPDVLIVDDSDRVLNGVIVAEIWDVVDRYLGHRPVFLDRLSGGYDGMDALGQMYDLQTYSLPNGVTMAQVISKKGTP